MQDSINDFAKEALKDFSSMSGAVGAFSNGLLAAATGQGGIEAFYRALRVSVTEFAAFEQAMIGVKKTVQASEAEYAAFGTAFQDLSGQMGIAAVEIAGVAESAGQLGIEKDSILAFTKTILELDIASDLTAESGATMLAQYANVSQLPVDAFDNMASSIVALGAAGATTESQILAMMLRIGGTAKTVGASQEEIAALAATFANAGVHAEQGGTAINKALLEINSAVLSGGQQLAAFAKTAGMSAQDFAKTWKESPYQALQAFLAGLQRLNAEGKDVAVALEKVGLTGTDIAGVMLRASVQADKMKGSLNASTQAFKDQNAQTIEANKQLDSLEGKWNRFTQSLTNSAAKIGAAFEYPLKTILDTLTAALEWDSKMGIHKKTGGDTVSPFDLSLYAGPTASGTVADSPQLRMFGEAGREYVIPVEGAHKAEGAALWAQAGQDLGLGMASGGIAGPRLSPANQAVYDMLTAQRDAYLSGAAFSGASGSAEGISSGWSESRYHPFGGGSRSPLSDAEMEALQERRMAAEEAQIDELNKLVDYLNEIGDRAKNAGDELDADFDEIAEALNAGEFSAGLEDLEQFHTRAMDGYETQIEQNTAVQQEFKSLGDGMHELAKSTFIAAGSMDDMFPSLKNAGLLFDQLQAGLKGTLQGAGGTGLGTLHNLQAGQESNLRFLEFLQATSSASDPFLTALDSMSRGVGEIDTSLRSIVGASREREEAERQAASQTAALAAGMGALASGAVAMGASMQSWASLSQIEQQMRLSQMMGGQGGMSDIEKQQQLANMGGLQAALQAASGGINGTLTGPGMDPFSLAASLLANQPSYGANPWALQAGLMAGQPHYNTNPWAGTAAGNMGGASTVVVQVQNREIARANRDGSGQWRTSNVVGM